MGRSERRMMERALRQEGLKVLVVGTGGRDHAIAWKFRQSPRVDKVFVAHGNAGMVDCAECVPAKTVEEMADFALREKIDLTFVGPEKPLSAGIVDEFESRGLAIVGPDLVGSRLESSKCDTKVMLRDLGIPVPDFAVFSDPEKAKKYVREVGYPVVVKADELAAGKGSLVCDNPDDAEQAVDQIMVEKVFGENVGKRVDVERRLYGREISLFCATDGYTVVPLQAAQDYKRREEGDKGKNTGGMGSFSPHPWLDETLVAKIMERIAQPIVDGVREEYGILYRGILYLGLMLVENADDEIDPYVLEINIRLGDPEAQVLLPRLATDLVDLCEAMLMGNLGDLPLAWSPLHYFCLAIVSGRCKGKKGWYAGYPDRYKVGVPIEGLERLDSGLLVFHSGTERNANGQIVTTGGRVLCVTGSGETLSEARELVYGETRKLNFLGMDYRRDLALA